MEINSMLLTDWYKVGHPGQYHPNTDLVYSNSTARNSRIPTIDKVVVAGIQAFNKKYLIDHFNRNFFSKPEEEIVASYSRRIRTSLGADLQPLKHEFYQKNYPGDPYGHIRHLHRLGFLPLTIKSLPEGSRVPMRVAFTTIRNSKKHPEMYWLTNFIETIFSASTWQFINSATTAREYRLIFEKYAMETVGNIDFVPFQGHDFSFRGMSSLETACYSGAAHLLSFVGTDTIPAIDFLEQYYHADSEKEMVGVSVAATEHAVMCSNTGFYVWDKANGDWDKIGECEFEVYKYLITELYPTGIVSIVSDTWDLWRVIVDYTARLKDEIMAREGRVVFRPDSGTPEDILCGKPVREYKGKFYDPIEFKMIGEVGVGHPNWGEWYPRDGAKEMSENERKGVIELLWDIFGGTITPMGYKLLDTHVGTIYGDSISTTRAIVICERLKSKGFASINWVAGIGSYTYQYGTRDTFGMAIKATYCEAMSSDGTKLYEIPIFKDPITDGGTKKSAKGLLYVGINEKGDYYMEDNVSWEREEQGELKIVFEDGVQYNESTLSEMRERSRNS